MRILLVHQYFLGENDPGGSRWNQFARYWAAGGHQITVLAGTVHYATGKKEARYKGRYVVTEAVGPNVTVKRCHVSESYNRSFLGRLWAYFSFALSSTWAGLLAGRHDVMICTSPPLTVGLTGMLLRLLKRIPMVFEVRDLWPETAIDTGVLRSRLLIRLSYWLERQSYRQATWINVLTPAFETSLIAKKGIDPRKISMIPNAADLDIVQPGERDNWVRQKHDLGGKFVVTYVGAHGVANCLSQILDAAELLRDRPAVQILLVGDGMEKPMLQERARQRGLTNVMFLDPVPKRAIGDYLAASDVCTAVLKRIETFTTVYPNKVFDYMSAARPIIVAIDGVARKLVEDAGAGLFVEPENAHQFAAAVRRMMDDADFRDRCGRSGYVYVAEHYSRQRLAKQYEAVLNQVVAREYPGAERRP